MGRYTGPLCRICRREKNKLYLKGDRCTSNCTLEKRKARSGKGQYDRGSAKMSGYAKHFKEKQRAKYMTGVSEEQFRNYFRKAEQSKGLTGEMLLLALERRLDNVILKLSIAPSRRFSRQMISHGNVLVNGVIKRSPSYRVKVADKITVKQKLKENVFVKKALERAVTIPSWLSMNKEAFVGEILMLPTRQDVSFPVDESLIVELYSK